MGRKGKVDVECSSSTPATLRRTLTPPSLPSPRATLFWSQSWQAFIQGTPIQSSRRLRCLLNETSLCPRPSPACVSLRPGTISLRPDY